MSIKNNFINPAGRIVMGCITLLISIIGAIIFKKAGVVSGDGEGIINAFSFGFLLLPAFTVVALFPWAVKVLGRTWEWSCGTILRAAASVIKAFWSLLISWVSTNVLLVFFALMLGAFFLIAGAFLLVIGILVPLSGFLALSCAAGAFVGIQILFEKLMISFGASGSIMFVGFSVLFIIAFVIFLFVNPIMNMNGSSIFGALCGETKRA